MANAARTLDQNQTLDQMNRYMVNTSAKNPDAAKHRANWLNWYEGLGWHERSIDPVSLARGRQIVTQFVAANGSQFGAERRTLRQGMKGDDVKTMQGIVGASPADGNFGPGTKAKVIAWQKKNGLSQDGIFGPASWAKSDSGTITDADREKVMALVYQTSQDSVQSAINNPAAAKPTKKDTTPTGAPMPSTAVMHPTIRQGSKGADVKEWQRLMNISPQDGNFGPATKKKTIAFQRDHQLKQDGIVGPKTWMAAYASYSATSNAPMPGAVIDTTNILPPAIAPTVTQMVNRPPVPQTSQVWQKPQAGVVVPPAQIPQMIGRDQGPLGTLQGSMANPQHWSLTEKVVGGIALLGAIIFGAKLVHHEPPSRRRR
jgi:peptidoglycan hydrolase-like protein with peptidoglycan-binding domain